MSNYYSVNNQTGTITAQKTTVIDFRTNNATFWTHSNISLTPEEYEELKDDSALLYALMDAGVEDWPGFGEALKLYRERKEDALDS